VANTRSSNVYVVDTTATFTERFEVTSIKFVGGSAASTVIIKDGGVAGVQVYEATAAAGVGVFEFPTIRSGNSLYVALTGAGAKVYLYTK
jgi:hypothetical protein